MPGRIASQDTPLVSVVMPVYNGAAFLSEAIGSILAQTHPHLEFIIVDDGSTDGSADVVRDFAARDARIRPVFTEHRGAQRARNQCVAAAQGEFIAHLDQDNIALRERLAAQLQWMRKTGVDICGSCTWAFGDTEYLRWVPEHHEDILHEFLFRTAMIHSTILLPARIAKANPFDEQITYGGYELLTRLASQYRMGNVPQVLLKYRRHPGQRTNICRAAVLDDQRRFRERHFHALFPEGTAEDYSAIARVADGEPLSSLAELERAKTWLMRMAQTTNNFQRDRMTSRWLATCQKSAHLFVGSQQEAVPEK